MALATEDLKAKAEVYNGDTLCQEKCQFLLKEVGLPNGLLPLKDIIECGYIEETGYVWLKQKKKIEHCFKKIGKLVSYGTDITAYVEKLKIRKLTGVKAKELFIWLTLTEISADGEEKPGEGKVTFQTSTGLHRCFPTSAFMLEEVDKKKEVEVKGEKEVEVKGEKEVEVKGKK